MADPRRIQGPSAVSRHFPQRSDELAIAMGDAARRQRTLVIGMATFQRLKLVQNSIFPSPRLDMTYIVEGAISLLATHPDTTIRRAWLAESLQALLNHTREQQPLPSARAGASADTREQEGSHSTEQRVGGRSLPISDSCFQVLRDTQDTTHSPRLSISYLAEGAIELLIQRRSDLLQPWVFRARQALQAHLGSLTSQLPQSLEIQP